MNRENRNLWTLLDGTPTYSSTKLIICKGCSHRPDGVSEVRFARQLESLLERQAGPGHRRRLI